MRLKKIAIAMALVGSILLIGCGNSSNKGSTIETKEKKVVNVVVPDGLPSITMAKIMKENPNFDETVDIKYSIEKGTDGLTSKVLSGEADIAIVPSNLAAQAYNKGLGYKLAATGGFGSFSLIGNEDIKTVEDLKGKTLTTIGKGMTPDIVLKAILKEKGIDIEKDITLNYLGGATELAPTFLSGKCEIAQIPEPMLTKVLSQKTTSNIIIDLNEEWKTTFKTENGYPQSSLIIKENLISDRDNFVNKFIKGYKDSIEFANNNTDKLGNYCEELGISVDKNILKDAIERSNLKFVKAKDSKKDYEKYYEILMESNSKVIGGKIPNEKIYYEE